MKPGFALSLSPDGISLLHRAAGGWRLVGSVELSSPDFDASLTSLRTLAERLEPNPISSKLVIPNDQIRYLSIETGLVDEGTRLDMARAALDGATPYDVSELAFDLSQDGSMTHVAAVAIETLEEAETFATEYGFGPTSFVAVPGDMGFLGEPFFGTARAVRGRDIEPDGIAVVDIGPAVIPTAKSVIPPAPDIAKPTASNGTSVSLSDSDEMDEIDSSPIAGFSSRRGKPGSTAPLLQGASRTDIPAPPVKGKTPPPPEALPKSVPSIGKNLDAGEAATIASQPTPLPANEDPAPPAAQISAPSLAPSNTATATDQTAFSSRRQPKPVAKEPLHSTRSVTDRKSTQAKAATEADLNTSPFSQREPSDVGGKPRYLGLALVVALLLFMAVVAAWALKDGTLFSFGKDPADQIDTSPATSSDDVEDLAEPETSAPAIIPVPAIEPAPEQLPEILAPQVSALPENLSVLSDPPITDPSEVPSLTETDTAVLDALRQPIPTELDPEAIADDVLDPATSPLPELSQAAQYAATGIWQASPVVPTPPAVIGLDDLYVASIDNTELSQDAVALPPSSSFSSDLELDIVTSPTAAGSSFDLDERGLVRATPEGTLNPDGVMVYLGRPSSVPPPTPDRPDREAEAEVEEQQAVLSRLRPRARPDDLVEQAERANLGGLSLAELGEARPRSRPASARPANENSLPTTEQAVATSVVPRGRPANFANLVDRAQRNANNIPASASASTAGVLTSTPSTSVAPTSVAPATVTPSIPTSASVARQATLENSINLRKVNLIGVYGKPSNRSALVRLSSGRYKKVKVGDRIDGGQVVAIGDSELRYQKGGRNLTLKMPNG